MSALVLLLLMVAELVNYRQCDMIYGGVRFPLFTTLLQIVTAELIAALIMLKLLSTAHRKLSQWLR
jgi:hypothetical protein